MRFQIALIGILASAIPAMAQSEHCKSITVPKERLACYDKTRRAHATLIDADIDLPHPC